MAWLGSGAANCHPVYNPHGVEQGASRGSVRCRALTSGSVILETAIPDQFRQPLDLVDFERHAGIRRSFHMVLGPNGRLWVAVEQGQNLSVLSLDLSAWRKETPIRITYSWCCETQNAWVGAENLETGAIKSKASAERPVPLYEDDLARILFAIDGPSLTRDVTCFAFAHHVEPLGYSEGIAAKALVDTEHGPRPIETLTPGTLISTQSGGLSPLVALIETTLPNVGSMGLVRLRRPFQNLLQTLDVTQRCEILTEGIDTAYLFGLEDVSIKAIHIAPFLPATASLAGLVSKRYNLVLADFQAYHVAGIRVMPLALNHDPHQAGPTRLSHLNATQIPKPCDAPASLLRHEALALLSDRYL